jgi:hypothetical protein
MPCPPDDSNLTPDQRRREIAAILARGVLRHRRSAQFAQESAESAPSIIPQKGLEVSDFGRAAEILWFERERLGPGGKCRVYDWTPENPGKSLRFSG